MTGDKGVGDDRAGALMKELAVTAEQQRAAGIRLAGSALAAEDGNAEAAKPALRDALEAIGLIPYAPPVLPKSSRMRPIVNYRRGGQ
jgi:hypothetical protein